MPDPASPRDIDFRPFPVLDWAAEHREASVRKMIDYVSAEARANIAWYLRKKHEKRIGARLSRVVAVIATSAAAIIPLIAQIYPQGIQPGWASIALVITAGCIALDRFYGYSSAWMRYLATEMQIRQSLHRFHMRIEMKLATLGGKAMEADDAEQFLALIEDFLLKLGDTVRDETATWSTELRAVLREMEAEARAHAQDQRSGEVKLTVSNGDTAANGWTVQVDNGNAETQTGRTATLRNVAPGRRTVQIRGTIGGQAKSTRKTVTVTAGETANLEMAFP